MPFGFMNDVLFPQARQPQVQVQPRRPVQVQPQQPQAQPRSSAEEAGELAARLTGVRLLTPDQANEAERRAANQQLGREFDQFVASRGGQPQTQPQAPQPQLADLQRHALMTGGGPAPAPLRVDSPPPVQIKAPDVPMPQARGVTPQQLDQRAQSLMQNMHMAGMRGMQQGVYAPTESGFITDQQNANYGRGQNAFLQALQQAGAEDSLSLQRQLGLDDLAVKRGALDVDAQKATAADALGRAEIASREGVAGREVASREQMARMGLLGELEKTRMQGAAELQKALAQQKGINTGAWMTALLSNPETAARLNAGGQGSLDTIDFLRSLNEKVGGRDTPVPVTGFEPNADLMRWLSGGGQMPMPAAPQTQPSQPVQVNPANPINPLGGGTPNNPDQVIRERGERTANFTPRDALMKKLADKRDFQSVLGLLSEFGDRVAPEDVDHVLGEMLNSGVRLEDAETSAGKNLLRLQRKVGLPENSPYRVATNNEGSTFMGLPFSSPSNNVQVLGPDGRPVFTGTEPSFPIGQWMAGTRGFMSDNLTQAGDTQDRREVDATLTLLKALQRKRGQPQAPRR